MNRFGWGFFLGLLVLPSSSHAADGLTRAAKQLAKGAASLPEKKIAVLAFPYHNGKLSSGSSILSERLTTDLVGKGKIRVIERRLIEKILQEKHLSETGALDPKTIKAIGAVLGADAIVTGTLIDVNDEKTEVNARMIEVESGEVLSAAQATVERSWTDRPASVRRQAPAGTPAPDPEDSVPATEEEKPKASHGRALKLSNENFPPDRRVYHPTRPSSTKRHPPYKENVSPEREDDDGYDGEEESREARISKTRKAAEPAEDEEPSIAGSHVQRFKRDVQRRRGGLE